MTQAQEIINTLSGLGVVIRVQEENLLVTPKSKVPADLVDALRQHKAEIMSLVCQKKAQVGDGRLPPLDRPPATEMEQRRLMDYLADPVAFARWFEQLMQQTDPAEEVVSLESSEYEGE